LRRSLFLLASFFLVLSWLASPPPAAALQVRVGLWENKPMCYTDENGKPAGIFISVLEYAAEQEDWQLEYLHGSWAELRSRLEKGEIDILPSMAISQEREKIYAFNQISVFNNWGEIYVSPSSSIRSLLDLKGKRIATLAEGIYSTGPEGIVSLNGQFNLQAEIIFVSQYLDALQAVKKGAADAAVVNRLVGSTHAPELGLHRSGIVFAPVDIRFALNRTSAITRHLAEGLDRHLLFLKNNNNSIYYQSISRALGGAESGRLLPRWFWAATAVFLGLLVLLLALSLGLRWQVKRKTSELREANAHLTEDIEKRMEAEEALRISEERFRSLVENSSDWIWEFDENEIFTYASPRVKELLGYEPDEVVGRSAFDFIPEDGREEVAREFIFFKEARKPFANLLNVNQHKDGHRVTIESSGVPIIDREGKFHGYRGIDRDISERRELETKLRQAYKMEAIGTLAGGIAHDFNNILSAILGYTGLARLEIGKSDPAQQSLQEVLNAGLRAKELVKHILAFSRQTEQQKLPVYIGPLFKEALKLLRASIPSTIDIKQDISKEFWAILADPTQIHQVIMNLCTNAAQAMEPDGGVLRVCLRNVDNRSTERADLFPGRYVQLSVSDTGMGIDPELQKRIFDPYFTTKDVGKGTGMGLAVVHGIVKSHGGLIEVESQPGQGTTFHVYFPQVEKVQCEECAPAVEIATGRERILLVDDEPALAEVGKRILEQYGYTVTAKDSSLDAYEAFRADPDNFDLIITDLTMPHLTGLELTRELRGIRPRIPVILCSGNSQKAEEGLLAEAGIAACIMKPLVAGELSLLVRKILDAAPSD